MREKRKQGEDSHYSIVSVSMAGLSPKEMAESRSGGRNADGENEFVSERNRKGEDDREQWLRTLRNQMEQNKKRGRRRNQERK